MSQGLSALHPATSANGRAALAILQPNFGAAIERATGGQVTRQELFPDTWARIWPELAAPAADLPGNFSGNSTIDHAAELRGAIAQTRLVFEGHRDAQDALEYLEQVLKAGQRAEVPAHACTPAPRDNSALAQIKRELFTTANQLQQPADLVVQLLVLAELRGTKNLLNEAQERIKSTQFQSAQSQRQFS